MSDPSDPYVRAAIEGEVARVAVAQKGERNITLFKGAAALASLGLGEGEIIRCLRPASESTGLRGAEFYRTVKSAVKAGQANPRGIPMREIVRQRLQSVPTSSDKLPARSAIDRDGRRPAFVPGGEDGPPKLADEVRRHTYFRNGRPVRRKIKRLTGYVNWYRVVDGDLEGWQAGKPDLYVACPYVGAIDPFDDENVSVVVHWPEGEKDCDTLSAVGLAAFTFGGTGDGLPDGAERYVAGRQVVILADNDSSGRSHAQKKAKLAHGVAANVRLVEFPELKVGGDVSDFLETASPAELQSRVHATALWGPYGAETERPRDGWRSAVITADALQVKKFDPVRYVLPGFISEGVTIFAGKPKIGKSWLLYDLCLACAAGRFVLGNMKPTEGQVLYLALEDSQRRLKQRLQKLWPNGYWPEALTLTTEWKRADAGGLDDIRAWCLSVARPILIVVDTLEKFRPVAKAHAAAYSTDYSAITGLHKLAHELGIAIVVVHHVRKMEADDPFDMVSGTNGLTGAADATLVLKRQSGNTTLYARGRDIEESETACHFNKDTCRWSLLGEAGEVHSSGQRSALLAALEPAGEEGIHISELMAAVGRTDRNAVDQLLYKMFKNGEVIRLKRGVYASAGKSGKKERSDSQVAEDAKQSGNLTDLTDLTAGSTTGLVQ